MSKALKNSEYYLRLLAKSSPRRRKVLLDHVNKEELKSLCEICLNILKGNISLDAKNFRRLKRNRQTIKVLANSKVPIKVKRQVVNQKGGFLGTLASVALPLLVSLFTK